MTNGLMCYLIGSGLLLSSIGVGVYKGVNSPYSVYRKDTRNGYLKSLEILIGNMVNIKL